MHAFTFSKERGDRATLNQEAKQLLEAKTRMKKVIDQSMI